MLDEEREKPRKEVGGRGVGLLLGYSRHLLQEKTARIHAKKTRKKCGTTRTGNWLELERGAEAR